MPVKWRDRVTNVTRLLVQGGADSGGTDRGGTTVDAGWDGRYTVVSLSVSLEAARLGLRC